MLDKTVINDFLARVHYLNHPYLSMLAGLACLLLGLFVFSKNRKSELHLVFLGITFSLSIWFCANAVNMYQYNNIDARVLWFRIAYTGAPFMAVLYYHFYHAYVKKNRRILYALYCFAFAELCFLWSSNTINNGLYALPNVGAVWNNYRSSFFYFLFIGMVKYAVLSVVTAVSFLNEFKKETIVIKRQQARSYAIMFFIMAGGVTEWLVIFNIPLHIAWFVIPPFLAWTAFSIIRYRSLDIETVVHRTFLWILASCFALIPIGLLFYIFHYWVHVLEWWQMSLIFSVFFYISAPYYRKIQLFTDHIFRRRKYDYYETLAKTGFGIGAETDILAIAKKLFFELQDALYVRNALLLMEIPKKSIFEEIDRIGFDDLKRIGVEFLGEQVILPQNSGLISWFKDYLKVLEKDRIYLDYSYEGIKEEALNFFNFYALEVLVPIILDGKLKGLLGLGKKENLQSYTARDIELLENMGRSVSVVLNSALRYQDIIEKELLDSIADGIDEGLILLDKDARIVWINTKVVDMYDIKEGRIIGKNLQDVVASEVVIDSYFLKEIIRKGGPFTATRIYQDKNSQQRYFELSVHPIKDKYGDIDYFLHTSRDLTERIKLEEELKKKYEGIKELQSQLEKKIKELEAFGRLAVDRELRMIELKKQLGLMEARHEG